MLKDQISRQLDELRKESKHVKRAGDTAKLDLWLSEIEDTIRVGLGKDAALVKEARKLQDQEEFNTSTIASATQLIDRAKTACRLKMLANGRDDLAEYVTVLVDDAFTRSRWLRFQLGMLGATLVLVVGGSWNVGGQTIDFGKVAKESRDELEGGVNRFKENAQAKLDAMDEFLERTAEAKKKVFEIEKTIAKSVTDAGKEAKDQLDGELKKFAELASQAEARLAEMERDVDDRIQQAVSAETVSAGVARKLATMATEVESLQSRIREGEERIAGFIEDLSATKQDVRKVSEEAPEILDRLAPIGKLDDRLQRVEQSVGFRWWDSVIGLTALSGLVLGIWIYRR